MQPALGPHLGGQPTGHRLDQGLQHRGDGRLQARHDGLAHVRGDGPPAVVQRHRASSTSTAASTAAVSQPPAPPPRAPRHQADAPLVGEERLAQAQLARSTARTEKTAPGSTAAAAAGR
ncbi:MAG: hypothetical protein R3F43_23935 [bacterium]